MVETSVIAPDISELRKIANDYIKYSANVRSYKVWLDGVKVTPGSNDAAKQLQSLFNKKMENYSSFLKDLDFGTYNLGVQLLKVADRYETAKNLTEDDVKRLDELVDFLKSVFPGLDSTLTKPELDDQ